MVTSQDFVYRIKSQSHLNSIKHSGSERVTLKLLSITGRKNQIAAPIRFSNSSSTYLLARVADVIQPRLATSAKQCRHSCSGPSTDSMTYRKCVSNFLYPDWQINNSFFNRPVMARTQILVHSWGAQNKDFGAVSKSGLTRVQPGGGGDSTYERGGDARRKF